MEIEIATIKAKALESYTEVCKARNEDMETIRQLRGDLKEALDALEACVGYYRDACGYVIGFPRNAAALLAKHRPSVEKCEDL